MKSFYTVFRLSIAASSLAVSEFDRLAEIVYGLPDLETCGIEHLCADALRKHFKRMLYCKVIISAGVD